MLTGRLWTLYEIFSLSYLNEFCVYIDTHMYKILRDGGVEKEKKKMPKERKRHWHKINKPRKNWHFMSNNWQVIWLIFIVSSFISIFLILSVDFDVLYVCLHPLKFHYECARTRTSASRILRVYLFSLSLSAFSSLRAHKTRTIVVLWRPSKLIWHNMIQDNLERMNTLYTIHIQCESYFQYTGNSDNNKNVSNRNKIRLRNKNEVSLLLFFFDLPSLSLSLSFFSQAARLNLSLPLCLAWTNYHYPWLARTFWLFIKLCVV